MGVVLTIDGADFGEVVSISGPTYSRTAIDTTNLASANDFRTYMKGISDAGEITLQVQHDADDPGMVKAIAEAQVAVNTALKVFTLTLKDDLAMSTHSAGTAMNGLLTKFEVGGIDVDGRVTVDMTIKISGVPTFAAG